MKNLSKMKKFRRNVKILFLGLGIVTMFALSMGCSKTELKSSLQGQVTPPKLITQYQSTELAEAEHKKQQTTKSNSQSAAKLEAGEITKSKEKNAQEVKVQQKQKSVSKADITYSTDIKPMLDNNCVQCHSSFGSYKGVTDEIVVGNPGNSNLIEAVEGGEMSGRLTSSQIKLLKEWIKAGAQK